MDYITIELSGVKFIMKNDTLDIDHSHPTNKYKNYILRTSLTYLSLILLGIIIGAGGTFTISKTKFLAKNSELTEKWAHGPLGPRHEPIGPWAHVGPVWS